MSNDDQASHLRQLMRQVRRPRRATTIAVTSGKGGVGKSNVALNISLLLAAEGRRRVALVDADLGLASLDTLLGLPARAGLSDVIAGSRKLEDTVVQLPGGVRFVPGAGGLGAIGELTDFQRAGLVQELAVLEQDNDIIVLDTGAGIGPDVLQLTANADTALVVTTPEPTSVVDAYAMISVLMRRSFAGQVKLLVNQAAGRHEAWHTHQRISDVAWRFLNVQVVDAGYVQSDPKVHEAVVARRALVLAFPDCPASKCLAAVAARLFPASPASEIEKGFFDRVASASTRAASAG